MWSLDSEDIAHAKSDIHRDAKHRGLTDCLGSVHDKVHESSGFLVADLIEIANVDIPARKVFVYKCTEQDIKLLFTDLCRQDGFVLPYSLCYQEGVATVVQIWQPDPDDDETMLEFSSRTWSVSGRDKRQIRKFRLDVPPESMHESRIAICTRLLSPRYLLFQFHDTAKVGYHLFDLFQLQEQSMEIIPALSPVWTSPLHNLDFVSDYNISGVVLVNTAGFEPSVRVTLRTSNGFVYLEIPAMRDIEPSEVKLSSVQFDLATTQNGVGDMSYTPADHQGYNHGVIELSDDEWLRDHWGGVSRDYRRTIPIMKWLCSIAAPWTQQEIDDSGATSQLRVGNTMAPPIRHSHRGGRSRYTVDDLSGRFVEHTIGRAGEEASTAKVILYTLDSNA